MDYFYFFTVLKYQDLAGEVPFSGIVLAVDIIVEVDEFEKQNLYYCLTPFTWWNRNGNHFHKQCFGKARI